MNRSNNKKVSFDFQQWLIRNCIVFVTKLSYLSPVHKCYVVVLCTQVKKTVTFFIVHIAAKLEIFTVLNQA